jgi:hypothetical protein
MMNLNTMSFLPLIGKANKQEKRGGRHAGNLLYSCIECHKKELNAHGT